MNQKDQVKTLNTIFHLPEKQAQAISTLGLIVDSVAPVKTNRGQYLMRLKIIDHSFHQSTCTIYINGNSLDDFPRVTQVGDIIYLRRYDFSMWNGTFQGKNIKRNIANYVLFSGLPSAKDFNTKSEIQEGYLNSNLNFIFNPLIDLRQFSQYYFTRHLVPLLTKSSNKSSDFDLILKVTRCESFNTAYKITLTDQKQNYQLHYRQHIPNGIYKVRSIADVIWQNTGKLIGNDYTTFLEIPNWMKSANPNQWQRLQNPNIGYQQITPIRQLNTNLLIEDQNIPELTLQELSIRQTPVQVAKINVQILEIFRKDFDECLRKFDADNFTEKNFDAPDGNLIYNVHFLVNDNSMKNQTFNLFLYSYDGKGKEFFSGINLSKIYGKNTLAYKDKFINIKNRLLEETSNQKTLKLLISPLHSKSETIYRIVDTELII